MSKYTTGEVAKLCDVTVRTVQYYDTRGILVPSELSEGGRRLYSEDDVKRMQIICFLRDLGLSIDQIRGLLAEEDPGSVLTLLLDQQEADLTEEINQRKAQLHKLDELRSGIESLSEFSVASIADIAYTMSNKEKLKKIHRNMLLAGLPGSIFQLVAIVLWIVKGWWWLFLIWAVIAIPVGVLISRYYFNHVAYICPQCHTVFKPTFKDAFFARHTPTTRKLHCTSCDHHGYCVEVARE